MTYGKGYGTADTDHPTAAQLEARRRADLLFLDAIRTCSRAMLVEIILRDTVRWRLVAARRQLRIRFHGG